MGCGKSKNAFVTENTLVSKTNSKRSNSIKKDDQNPENGSIVDQKPSIVTENLISNELVNEEPEKEKTEPKNDMVEVANVEEKKENVQVWTEKIEEIQSVEAKEEINVQVLTEKIEEIESVEAKEEINDVINTKEDELIVGVEKKVKEGTTVPESPNEFLFDHEETIESIISDGISGKSEYHSPRAKHVAEDVATGKVNGQEAQPEDKLEAGKGAEEEIKVDEGKEVVLVEETKEPAATTGEEKIAAEKEEVTSAAATSSDVIVKET